MASLYFSQSFDFIFYAVICEVDVFLVCEVDGKMNSNFGGLGSLGGGSGSGLFPSTGVSQNNSGGSFGGFGTNAGLGGTGLGGVGSAGLGGVTGTNGGTNGGVTGTAGTNNTDSAANNKNGGENLVLEEEMDENYEPTDQEIAEYAEWLGMDVEDDKELLWIAKEGLKAPLPNPWKPCQTQEGEIFYFNFEVFFFGFDFTL